MSASASASSPCGCSERREGWLMTTIPGGVACWLEA